MDTCTAYVPSNIVHTTSKSALYEVLTLGTISSLIPDHNVKVVRSIRKQSNDETFSLLSIYCDTLGPEFSFTDLLPEANLKQQWTSILTNIFHKIDKNKIKYYRFKGVKEVKTLNIMKCDSQQKTSKIEAFEELCYRRLLRITWTAFRTNASVRQEIGPYGTR